MEFLAVLFGGTSLVLLFFSFFTIYRLHESEAQVEYYAQKAMGHQAKHDASCTECASYLRALDSALNAYHTTNEAHSKAAMYIAVLKRQYEATLQENAILRSRQGGVRRQLSKNIIKDLLVLCHPDKHGNTELSGKMTRWLIKQRKK